MNDKLKSIIKDLETKSNHSYKTYKEAKSDGRDYHEIYHNGEYNGLKMAIKLLNDNFL